jgi:hypothetical protein
MAKQTVNLGTMADNKSGDPLRTAFEKINENFDELYARPVGGDADSIVKEAAGLEELGVLQDTYQESVIQFEEQLLTMVNEEGYPFGVQLPITNPTATYETLMQLGPNTTPAFVSLVVIANSMVQAYTAFQEAIASAEITSGDVTLRFNNLGELVFPDGTKQTTAFTDEALSTVKTWTTNDETVWRIEEAHGGLQFDYLYPSGEPLSALVTESLTDVSYVDIDDSTYPGFYGSNIRSFTINATTFDYYGNEWLGGTTYRYYLSAPTSYTVGDAITGNTINNEVPLEPVKWWDSGDLPNGGENFRGAIIDYHAFSPDCGTMIGTIKIADDSGDNTVTHSEVASGGNDTAHIKFWGRGGGEGQLFFYRTDGEEDQNVKIQWTAKVFYGPEIWD